MTLPKENKVWYGEIEDCSTMASEKTGYKFVGVDRKIHTEGNSPMQAH